MEGLQFLTVNLDLQIVSNLIDPVHIILHLENRPAVIGHGSL